MKRLTVAVALVGCVVGAWPVCAEEPKGDQPTEGTWSELTAQYTMLFMVKQYAKSSEIAQRALAVAERAFSADDPKVAQTLNDLGTLYQLQGRAVEAEPIHQRALAIRTRALPGDDPAVAQSLNNLAKAYQAEGKYADAQPLLQQSLSVMTKHLGENSLHVAVVLGYLADGSSRLGENAKAEELFKRSLAIIERNAGNRYLDVQPTLERYAAFLRSANRPQEADAIDAKAAALRAPAPTAHQGTSK